VIKAENVVKIFSGRGVTVRAVDGVTTTVDKAEVVVVIGPSGSGKSTFIKILLEDYDLEESLYKWGSKVKIGYLAQEVKFKDDSLSVLQYFMNEHEVNQSRARSELAKLYSLGMMYLK